MKIENFTFLCPTKTGFGLNALEHLPFDLSGMGAQKPLVLKDKTARLAGLVKPLARAFKESGMTLGICPSIDRDKQTDVETLKQVYQIFTHKGFDCILVLGTGPVADLAKALSMAVSLGPEALRTSVDPAGITRPLTPWAYLPTGMGTGMETGKTARFNGKSYVSPFLCPDLAVIDPLLIVSDPFPVLVNAGLTCLAVCCEAHVLSKNPPARAYAATGITLIMENLLPLIRQLDSVTRPDKKAVGRHRANLAHAAVITGYVLANCEALLSVRLGKSVADQCNASPGQAMAVLLPAVLEVFSTHTPDLGNLLLPLCGQETFCAVPAPQRKAVSIQTIQGLVNELFRISVGTVPRTLADAGMDETAIAGLIQSVSTDIRGVELKSVETILAHAVDGRPVKQG